MGQSQIPVRFSSGYWMSHSKTYFVLFQQQLCTHTHDGEVFLLHFSVVVKQFLVKDSLFLSGYKYTFTQRGMANREQVLIAGKLFTRCEPHWVL